MSITKNGSKNIGGSINKTRCSWQLNLKSSKLYPIITCLKRVNKLMELIQVLQSRTPRTHYFSIDKKTMALCKEKNMEKVKKLSIKIVNLMIQFLDFDLK